CVPVFSVGASVKLGLGVSVFSNFRRALPSRRRLPANR
ncbi:MAG: hypothetical protein ACI814_004662, partial [Mariniblastus sp.]